ncbi:hypothetical protein J2S53_002066 [Actinopolyspora lacussalsi]|nr:hypothetical protein [Actinopolyspora lacussalsi]
MSFRKKAASLVGALAMTGLGMAGFAAPASAESCPAGALCAWYSSNVNVGDPGTVYGDNYNLLQYAKFADAGSIYNNGNSCNVAIYTGLNYTGTETVVKRNYQWENLDSTAYAGGVASNNWCV